MKLIPKEATRAVYRAGLQLKKHSPDIMFAGGLVGVVTSTVLACRATLKLSEELPKMKDDLESAREANEDPAEQKKAVAVVYGANAMMVAKLYAPSVVIGGLSVGALTGSHVQLTRRNAALTAAYAALDKAYDEYRRRVENELGDEKERDFYRATSTEKVDLANGKKADITVVNPNGRSPYARFFDESSRNFQKDAGLNRAFVECQQNYANHKLNIQGHLVLNDVYEMLGLEHSKEGAVVGWVLDRSEDHQGDNYVDFGLFEIDNSRFINGDERAILLDFNVDGVIYDKI